MDKLTKESFTKEYSAVYNVSELILLEWIDLGLNKYTLEETLSGIKYSLAMLMCGNKEFITGIAEECNTLGLNESREGTELSSFVRRIIFPNLTQ
jgi:hypothetical protein